MDLLWFYRYKRGGGESSFVDWEFSAGLDDWSKAPAPAQVGKRLFEALFQQELSPRWVALTNNVMHWICGLFGTVVWTADYIVLPLAKVYKPMWEYDVPTLAKDLSAHLVYGVGTSLAFNARH
jgi:hypothetical protein